MLPWFQNGQFPLYLAPMAGYTDVVFRELCKQQGADVLVSEFVMAEAFLRDIERAWETVDFTAQQRPMGVQIFGSEPEAMGKAARLIVDRLKPDFIDMNFGCPAPRITCQEAGSACLKDLGRLEDIARAVVEAVPETPVTGKIRIGWDDTSVVATEASLRLQRAGAQAVAIHGRTRVQQYKGEPDWNVINAAAEAVDVPVIGNGNVRSAQDVARLRETSPVRGLMVGRAALGNPWIFHEIKTYLATGQTDAKPDPARRWSTMLLYARLMLERSQGRDEARTFGRLRAKLKTFARDMPQARILRNRLDSVKDYEALKALASEHEATCAELVG